MQTSHPIGVEEGSVKAREATHLSHKTGFIGGTTAWRGCFLPKMWFFRLFPPFLDEIYLTPSGKISMINNN